jgi:hypothetical protein
MLDILATIIGTAMGLAIGLAPLAALLGVIYVELTEKPL